MINNFLKLLILMSAFLKFKNLIWPLAAARFYRVVYLIYFPRDAIAREQG